MATAHLERIQTLQQHLAEEHVDSALVTDADAIFYLSGYWGYASLISCGRPNFLWVPKDAEPEIITPSMELEMCLALSAVEKITAWTDGLDGEWTKPLRNIFSGTARPRIAIEKARIPGLVLNFINQEFPGLTLTNLDPILGAMRMIQSAHEIDIMRQAGQVAVAMVRGAKAVIGVDVPEYEVSLAVAAAGTRKAAELLDSATTEPFVSPMIHNLQILGSGHDTCMVHRRPTTRLLTAGDPIYLCFCGITVFRGYWLGFDREFFCGSVTDEQARLYELVVRAQSAALEAIRPGAIAQDVHFAADAVYQEAGMTFAIDGGLSVTGKFGARVGDSVVVTEEGYEYLTPYPKELRVL